MPIFKNKRWSSVTEYCIKNIGINKEAIMQELIKEIEAAQIKEVTDFNVGDTIKVHAKIVEGNRERIQVLKVL